MFFPSIVCCLSFVTKSQSRGIHSHHYTNGTLFRAPVATSKINKFPRNDAPGKQHFSEASKRTNESSSVMRVRHRQSVGGHIFSALEIDPRIARWFLESPSAHDGCRFRVKIAGPGLARSVSSYVAEKLERRFLLLGPRLDLFSHPVYRC